MGTLHVDVVVGEDPVTTECVAEGTQWTPDSLLTQFGLQSKDFTTTQLQAV